MEHFRSHNYFPGMAVMALALVLAAGIGAWTIHKVKSAGDTITVTGSHRTSITSDYVVVRMQISSQRLTAAEAYSELERHRARLLNFLKQAGVSQDDIHPGNMYGYPISKRDKDGMETGEILAHRLNQDLEIRSNDVIGVPKAAMDSNELLKEGISINVYQAEYLYTKLPELRHEMLGRAIMDARQRAEIMAKNAESGIGKLKSARMGVFQITRPYSTDISDYGMYDTSSLEKDVTAVVTATFGLR